MKAMVSVTVTEHYYYSIDLPAGVDADSAEAHEIARHFFEGQWPHHTDIDIVSIEAANALA